MAEQENPYQVSRASIETYGSVQEGIEFSFGRMLKLGFKGFFSNFFMSAASGLIQYIMASCASALAICGGFIILPHLFAGMVSYGSSAVRGKAKLEDLFKPFNQFGGVFLAGLLYFLFFIAGAIVLAVAYFIAAAVTAVSIQTAIESGNLGSLESQFTEDLIVSLIIFVSFGLIFLTVHYIMARLDLVYPLVYELRIGPWDAFVQSWRLTRGHGMGLFFGKLFIITVPILLVAAPFIAVMLFVLLSGSLDDPDTFGAGSDASAGAGLLVILAYLLMILLTPLAYGLIMTLQGAIANLFLTESVKQQLVPGYEEDKPKFVSTPPQAAVPGASTPSMGTSGSSTISPEATPFAGETEVRDEPAENQPGVPENQDGSSQSDRFPRSDAKKDDPFNPYN